MKKVLSLILVLLLLTGFTACGQSDKASGNTTPSQSTSSGTSPSDAGENQTNLVIWTRDRADAVFMQPAIDEYNKTNADGIYLDYQMYTDNYEQALDMAYATNSGPDLVAISGYTDIFVKYVHQGQYVCIDDYMTAEQKERYSGLLAEGSNAIDGKFYYLPMCGSTGRLFYNVDIFERCGISEPPKTISEMTAAAKKITDTLKGEGIYGFAMNLKSPASALGRSLDFMVQRSGGPKQGFDFSTGTYDFEFYAPFIEEFREIFTTDIAFPGCESLDIDPLRTQFADGKIGMYISWSHADPGVYANQFPTDENWNIAQLPILDGAQEASQSIQPYKGFMITKRCEAPELAWKACVDLFYSDDFVKGYHEAGLGCTIVDDLKSKVEVPEILIGKEEGLLGDKDKFWPATPHELNDQAVIVEGNDQYQTFMELIFGKGDIDKSLQDLTNRYNSAYQKGIDSNIGNKIQIPNFDPANPQG